MDIIVEGKGELKVKPNQIKINFTFTRKENKYEDALNLGVKDVNDSIDMLLKLNFNKDDIKTNNLSISENKEYDNEKRKYNIIGYSFNQNINLTFDYDIEKMFKVLDEFSKVQKQPTYNIEFGLKDENFAKEELIKLAFDDAKFQAQAIAKASGNKLKKCEKISFEPFTNSFLSNTNFGMRSCVGSHRCNSEGIENVFVPEDIILNKEIYTLWKTE